MNRLRVELRRLLNLGDVCQYTHESPSIKWHAVCLPGVAYTS